MTPVPPPFADEPAEQVSVGDHAIGKTRLLSRQCPTCIFRPGNLMSLSPGRLHDLVAQARAQASYIICHETLPGAGQPASVPPAICRGFRDRYDTTALQIIAACGVSSKSIHQRATTHLVHCGRFGWTAPQGRRTLQALVQRRTHPVTSPQSAAPRETNPCAQVWMMRSGERNWHSMSGIDDVLRRQQEHIDSIGLYPLNCC